MNEYENLIHERKAALLYVHSLRGIETPALFINFFTADFLMKCQGLPFQYKSMATVMTESA